MLYRYWRYQQNFVINFKSALKKIESYKKKLIGTKKTEQSHLYREDHRVKQRGFRGSGADTLASVLGWLGRHSRLEQRHPRRRMHHQPYHLLRTSVAPLPLPPFPSRLVLPLLSNLRSILQQRKLPSWKIKQDRWDFRQVWMRYFEGLFWIDIRV